MMNPESNQWKCLILRQMHGRQTQPFLLAMKVQKKAKKDYIPTGHALQKFTDVLCDLKL